MGCFQPYIYPYRAWKENGLKSMQQALDDSKDILAITLDAQLFYHSVPRHFVLHQEFLKKLRLEEKIGADETHLTRILLSALDAWAELTPLHTTSKTVGLPVGLSVSRLIANVSLAELDKQIKSALSPIYYGRYVDDILLVIENSQRLKNEDDVFRYLRSRVDLFDSSANGLELTAEYFGNDYISFSGSKTRIFNLNGPSGKALLESIEQEMRKRSSEWRNLPDLPDSADEVTKDVLMAVGQDGIDADNLRLVEGISIRRAELAFRVRDAEAYQIELPASAWAEQRKGLVEAATKHLITLPLFFEVSEYFPRLVGLTIACRDYSAASDLIKKLLKIVGWVQNDTYAVIAGQKSQEAEHDDILSRWREKLQRDIRNAAVAALTPKHKEDRISFEKFASLLEQIHPNPIPSFGEAIDFSERMFERDLGRIACRFRYFPYATELGIGPEVLFEERTGLGLSRKYSLPDSIEEGTESFYRIGLRSKAQVPVGLLFPTRPFTISELYFLVSGETDQKDSAFEIDPPVTASWMRAFRGFSPPGPTPRATTCSEDEGTKHYLIVPREKSSGPIKIAVTSLDTSINSWNARVAGYPEPDATRYRRINRLINSLRSSVSNPDYVVFPELSIPPHWYLRIAHRLALSGKSLIAGVEYLVHGPNNKCVANQVWASLTTSCFGYACSVIYRQDKLRPAQHEELELNQLAGLKMEPIRRNPVKRIVCHGDFHFGLLICSELTNIKFRSEFRGYVDAVFVPEWNQDVETFNSLVESAALDIHAFIIQCNHRDFGDSRIRAPMKDSWARDVVRIKGGLEDYYVVGAIDFHALRQFQTRFRSPSKPFKPVPDGFSIGSRRKELPLER
ncbi:MAG: RNA-directed DNA polymerase [Proteobacteria bacterium]|nr:MAG: RNA-directed DNA polymerase [Pseudomonadota bacterium]